MGGEDAQLELREADLQVLKVVTFGSSSVFTGLFMEVLVQRLQLCTGCNFNTSVRNDISSACACEAVSLSRHQ